MINTGNSGRISGSPEVDNRNAPSLKVSSAPTLMAMASGGGGAPPPYIGWNINNPIIWGQIILNGVPFTPSGTGTVTSVGVSGGTTGLTVSNSPVTTSGVMTLGGTLVVANGGTGGTNAKDAMINLLPAQASQGGKFLTTDGSGNLSWAVAGGGGGTPGGSQYDVQYNDGAGGFAGVSDLSFTPNVSNVSQLAIGSGGAFGTTGQIVLGRRTAGAGNNLTIQSAIVPSPWTLTFPTGPGTNGQVLTTNGSGVTSWTTVSGGGGVPAAPVNSIQFNNAGAFGGDAAFTYSSTGVIQLGTASSATGAINLANTGSANLLTVQSGINASAWTLTFPTGAGTNGQVLTTNGSGLTSWTTVGGGSSGITVGTTTITSGTAGSIPFNDGTVYSEDNANLFWDSANTQLLVGTNTAVTSPTDVQFVVSKDAYINGITAGRGAGQDAANTIFGANAYATGSSSNNTAFGSNALNNSTGVTGSNAAFGSSALSINAGNGNTGIGHRALANCTGSRNTAVGRLAMSFDEVQGNENTALGISALGSVTTGSGNIAIGRSSGFSLTTGSNNVIIGSYDGSTAPISATGDNFVVLSDGAGAIRFATNASGALSFDGSSYGTAGQFLQSNGSGAAPTWVTAGGGGGMVYPAAGLPISTGSAWDSSITLGAGVATAFTGDINTANGLIQADIRNNISLNAVTQRVSVETASPTSGIGLSAFSARTIVIVGSNNGPQFSLPNATTLTNGATFTFINKSTTGASSVSTNGAGTTYSAVSGKTLQLVLTDNSTSAGVWVDSVYDGVTPPAGVNTSVQFNNNGAFGADGTFFTYDATSVGNCTLSIGAPNPSGKTGQISLFHALTANKVTLRPAVNTAAWTLVLPNGPGTTGQFLRTNGGGVATWDSVPITPAGADRNLQFNNNGTLAGALYASYNTGVNADLFLGEPATSLPDAPGVTGTITLSNGLSLNTTTIQCAEAGLESWTLTLPVYNGEAGDFLQTDGTGVTSWVTPAAATLQVESTVINSGTDNQLLYQKNGKLGEASLYYDEGQARLGVGVANAAAITQKLTVAGDADINGIRIGRGEGNTVTNTIIANGSSVAGFSNVVIGYESLGSCTSAAECVSIGANALGTATSNSGSTAVGYNALNLCTSSYSIGLGYNSGSQITSGSFNVVIGSHTGGASGPINATGNNFIVLSDGVGNIGSYWDGTTKDQYTYGKITTGIQSTTAGALILANLNAGNFPTTIQSSLNATAAWALTLPVDAGTSGQVLTTDGNGETSWANSVAPAAVWASIYDTSATQSAAAINTDYVITLNSIDPDSSGISVVSGSRVTVASAGVYTFAPSIQMRNTSGQIHEFSLWFRKNGTDITNSASQFSVHGSHGGIDGYAVPAVVFTFKLAANDYIEMVWSTNNLNVEIYSIAAAAPVPAAPGVVLSVTKV